MNKWSRRGFMRAGLLSGVIGGLSAACSQEGDLAEGDGGRVARVLDGDSLALDTGLRAEVESPAAGYGDRADDPGAAAARSIVERAAVGRQARLWYGGLSRDRYQRAIAHVIARDEAGADIWLNGLAVRQGAARVRTFPDNAKRARRLRALESEARAGKRGLWA
ncbi:MAG: thermonuclease family protein [Hyphomonadaceae bacterium]